MAKVQNIIFYWLKKRYGNTGNFQYLLWGLIDLTDRAQDVKVNSRTTPITTILIREFRGDLDTGVYIDITRFEFVSS